MIDHADQPYKAILAIIYETGARWGEVLSLKVGDVEDVGDYIRLKIRKSKSKPRMVAVVRYQNVVRDWLRRHAQRDDPDAPLFYTRTGRQVMASNLYMYIFRLRKRLGIKERIYPHLLCHYRATELYGKLSEKEMMQWFSWDTRYMIDIYSHLKETVAIEKILAIHGIGGRDGKGVETVECPRCGTRKPADARYCYRCGSPITIESAIDRERKVEEAKYIIDELVELAMENPELLKELLARRARQRGEASASTRGPEELLDDEGVHEQGSKPLDESVNPFAHLAPSREPTEHIKGTEELTLMLLLLVPRAVEASSPLPS